MEKKKEDKQNKEKSTKVPYMCLGILLGLIIGLTLGRMLFNNPGSGMTFFTGLGMVIGSLIDNRDKKNGR